MKEIKFTKGGWVTTILTNGKSGGCVFITNVEGTPITVMDFAEESKFKVITHARLIAAAPTHDKALCMIEEKLPVTHNTLGGEYTITLTQQEVHQIIRTLTKARGGY